MTREVLERPFRALLLPGEAAFLAKAQPRSIESLYALLEASPTLDEGREHGGLGIRRTLLMELLRPRLAPGFLAAVEDSYKRPVLPGGAAPPDSGSIPDDVAGLIGGAEFSLLSPPGQFVDKPGAAGNWNLLKLTVKLPAFFDTLDFGPLRLPATPAPFPDVMARTWKYRDQGTGPTCIAYASVACLERMGARDGQPIPRLSARFLYQRMSLHPPAKAPPGAEKGYTKLSQARDALLKHGICLERTWPDDGPLDEEPSAEAIAEAARYVVPDALHKEFPIRDESVFGTLGIAAHILAELTAGRPVAVAMPAVSASGDPALPTNWSRADVLWSGEVDNPSDIDDIVPMSGHAVCIVGFQPSGRDPMGGYFIFRNSVGSRFGSAAPIHSKGDPPPRVPGPGYGTISALAVEGHVWELLSLTSPASAFH